MNQEVVKSLTELLNLQKILSVIMALVVTWAFLWGVRHLSRFLARKFPRRRVMISNVFPVLRLGVWLGVIAFVIAAILRPESGTLLALSATAGVAVGIGAQDLIKNVLAGVLILLERPFHVGDMIQADSHYGEVVNIGLRATQIHTFGDSTVTLPNNLLLSQGVTNANTGALVEQVEMEFVVPGTARVLEIRELAREAALCSPYVYRKKPVTVLVEDRFDRAFLTVFKVKAYVLDVRFERLLSSDVIERIKQELAGRGLFSVPLY